MTKLVYIHDWIIDLGELDNADLVLLYDELETALTRVDVELDERDM
jgi:hypothetical protein